MRAVLSTTFRSLQVRNYRLFATGQLVKLVGVWMMFTAQDWLVLDLSHNSPGALGIVTALQFLPGAAAHPVGRQARRPVRQAQAADRRQRRVRGHRDRLRDPGRQRRGRALARLPLRRACWASPTPSRPRYARRSSPSWSSCRCCPTPSRSRRPPSTPPGSAVRRWPASRWRCCDTGPVFLIATALAIAPVFSYRPDAPAGAAPRRPSRPSADGRPHRRRPAVRVEAATTCCCRSP